MRLSLSERVYAEYLLQTSEMPICDSLYEDDLPKIVQYLIERNAEINHCVFDDKNGRYTEFRPVYTAMGYERYYSLLVLLKAGASINTQSKRTGAGLLFESLYNQQKPVSIMRLFLHFGGDPSLKHPEQGDCYQVLAKKPLMLKVLKTTYARVLQIKSHQQLAAQAFQEKNGILAAKVHKQLADLYWLDVSEEKETPFREYYVTEMIKHLSKTLEYTAEPNESIKTLNKLSSENMRSSMRLLSKKPFFYPDVERVIENVEKKVSAIGKQEGAEETLSKLYDILAELYGIIECQTQAMTYAAKAAELTPKLQREAYMVSTSSSSHSEEGSSTGSDVSSHSGSDEDKETTPFLSSGTYRTTGQLSYAPTFEKGKSALRKRRVNTAALQKEEGTSNGVKF